MGLLCEKPLVSDKDINKEIIEKPYRDIGKREIISEKSKVRFQIIENGMQNSQNIKPIELEVIHVDTIDSTMPASREYIDQGNKLPFIYNTVIQTQGKGKGARKWAGSISGNIYTSSSIPINMIKNEINANDIIVKITAISIIQQIRRYSKDFYLKYPNDIICVDRRKIGGIIAENYKDFCIIGFGINIVDKPEQSEIRKEGLSPCFVNEHLPKNKTGPTALDLSIEITKQIICNLRISKDEVNELFEKYVKKEKN